MTKEEVFADMRQRGFVKVVAEFSGGNDEGGVERTTAYTSYVDTEGVDLGGWDTEDPVAQFLAEIVDGKYGSFAGDFYVNGNVTADLESQTIEMTGSEDVPQSHPFTDHF